MAWIKKLFGPPGTGKTTRLMAMVEEEVRGGVPLDRIGYLSFSRSAAEVIRERMNAGEKDVQWFRTIHGACARRLSMAGAIIDHGDYRQFSRQTGMRISPREVEDDISGAFNLALHAHNLALATGSPLEEICRNVGVPMARVLYFEEKWAAYKQSVARFDFTDMLTEYLDHGDPLPCDVIFLDEAQDLSALQWQVFHKMAKNCARIYMAGDDDQAIFNFLGSSEYGFLDHDCDEEEVLSQSWRVPHDIGVQATRVVSRIPHRKEKDIKWKDSPGQINRMGHEPMSLPWAAWIEKYESIMVLCRHRAVARRFSDDLNAVYIPHSLHGESPSQWKEARIVRIFTALKAGQTVTPKQAGALLLAFGRSDKAMRDCDRRQKIDASMLDINFGMKNWATFLGRGDDKRAQRYRILERVGADEPRIHISTMHSAKGREADLVVISPECNATVRKNLHTATETRLAYVSLTRAKKQCVVLMPHTENFMTHFFGG